MFAQMISEEITSELPLNKSLKVFEKQQTLLAGLHFFSSLVFSKG